MLPSCSSCFYWRGNHTSNTSKNSSNYLLGPKCPRDWVLSLHGECFKVFSNGSDWNSAKSACEELGSDLAVLNSKAKLRGFLASAAAAYKEYNLWIGLHRDPTHKPSWYWVGGLQVTFVTWDSGQPGDKVQVEDCGVLRISSKKWHDYACSGHRLGYICESNGKYNLHDKKTV